ncbi:mersacidin/lichenicidin family type 2 lantibiotic [Archangium lansingense]|uniref:mersacidin/lichenicidin family type 2 lantibiotic n=1 Tax=Archangium lansingense TaxID=2995310 RepID=UPI003B7836F6
MRLVLRKCSGPDGGRSNAVSHPAASPGTRDVPIEALVMSQLSPLVLHLGHQLRRGVHHALWPRDGHATIIRAWKDPRFRASLTSEQRDSLPEGTCGKSMAERSEEDRQGITGGALLLNPQVLQLNRPVLAKTECVSTHH